MVSDPYSTRNAACAATFGSGLVRVDSGGSPPAGMPRRPWGYGLVDAAAVGSSDARGFGVATGARVAVTAGVLIRSGVPVGAGTGFVLVRSDAALGRVLVGVVAAEPVTLGLVGVGVEDADNGEELDPGPAALVGAGAAWAQPAARTMPAVAA